MSTEFTYPSLRCIVEYLTPQKRIHIAARSPQLRLFDKSVPLHLIYLEIRNNGFKFNGGHYGLYEELARITLDDQELAPITNSRYISPGDLVIWPRHEPSHVKQVELIISGGGSEHRKLPLGLRNREASKILYEAILGYKTIYVSSLGIELYGFVVLRLPANLKIRPRTLRTDSSELFDFVPIIDVDSLPLKKVDLTLYDVNTLKHPIVATAETLEIKLHGDILIDTIRSLPNKHVELRKELSMEQVLSLINYWIKSGKSMGSTIEFEFNGVFDWKIVVKEFGGLLEIMRDKSRRLFIPMNSASQLNIYKYKNSPVEIKIERLTKVVQQKAVRKHSEKRKEQAEPSPQSNTTAPTRSSIVFSFSLLVLIVVFLLLAIAGALFFKLQS